VEGHTTNTWETLEPLPTARSGLTASTLSGAIFVFGGESSLYTFEENEAYITEEGWLSVLTLLDYQQSKELYVQLVHQFQDLNSL